MADEGFKRKLTAILSADVVGYSHLMEDNEDATIQTLNTYLDSMSTLVQKHRGRVVDMTGDNLMAEFSSVVDAVKCAVETQKEMNKRNAKLPENRQMLFRMGVNLGDIVEEKDRIYGDGVNIAARLEGLAEAGGICISRTAYDQVKKKLELGYEYLGEHRVKNISEPVHVYRVLMEPEAAGKVIGEKRKEKRRMTLAAVIVLLIIVAGLAGWYLYFEQSSKVEPASMEKMAYPLPDKPSIAVLAFDNMSDDPKQEYLSDGIAENIITALSKTDQLFVIARNSTFTYKSKPVKVKQVAEELGVRYVLEGSVQKTEDRVRITAQLIDAISGHHLWAERYDRDLKEIFAMQDEITMKIVTALRVRLTEGEQARLWSEKYENIDILLKSMESLSLWRKGTKESHIRQGQVAKEIIEMAPESPIGYGNLAWYYWHLFTIGESPQESVSKAFKLAQKALTLDESDASTHALLGSIYLLMRKYEKAITAGERSIKLAPNGAMYHGILGLTLNFAGRQDEAIKHLKQGIRLNPFPAYWYFGHLSRCYLLKSQYEDALTAAKKALHLSPDAPSNHRRLAIIYTLLNRQEEAVAATKKALELDPNFSVERAKKLYPFKNQADLKLYIGALRKAGFPEKNS